MGDGVLGIVVSTVFSSLVVVVAFAIAHVSSEEADNIPLWAVALLEIPLWVGFVGVPVWASRTKGRGSLAADFGLRMEPKDVLVGLACGFVGQFLIGFVLLPLYDLFGIDQDKVGDTAEKLADRAHDPVGVVCLFLVVVVGAAIFEELFYRGLWMRSIARRFGTVPAVVLTAVLFGLMHFQPLDTFALTAFGLIAGTLAARYGRLGPAIWAHVAFNLTALVSLLAK
jgi:membrane protease YdiL (CAAX protease family)